MSTDIILDSADIRWASDSFSLIAFSFFFCCTLIFICFFWRLKRSLWILIFSSFLLRISVICWSCFCSVFSDFSYNRWRTSTAVLDDDVSVKFFDLCLFALSLPSGRDVSIFSFPDSAWPATLWLWVGGDDIPSGDVQLFSSRNLLFHLASLRSFFQQCMMVKGSVLSYICTASSIYTYEYRLNRFKK